MTGPLNAFTADPERLQTAEDRQVVMQSCAAIVKGLASAIATVSEKVFPPSSISGRWRNRRWSVASVHLDDAAGTAARLGERLHTGIRPLGDLVAERERVRYAGSLTAHHGRYLLAGYCTCDPDCEGFELTHGPGGVELHCVNASSMQPDQGSGRQPGHEAHSAGYLLDTEPRKLPEILDVTHAITITRGLSTITSRARTILAPWHDAFATVFNRRCLVHVNSWGNGDITAGFVLKDLDSIRPELTLVRTHLRDAIRVLAEIEADPETRRRAA
ncbi:hypothetical protein [Actinoplanes sp. M2I2]|uniref:hypothetical protein n=1 Tax=Actinoplanes sp. M2I2 TaxID=1734444 RepID=UPI002021FFF4|nr:hypothetical protein [Actinoplanes sp. M2I2]